MKDKRVPINTTRRAQEFPQIFLLDALESATRADAGGRTRQENVGQASFVGSDTLPSAISADDKKILESCGVVFHGQVKGDELFQYVTLPKDWKKVPTDHGLWSKLEDEKGRVRGSIFYKAAHYDRKADMNLCSRYGIERDYDRKKYENIVVCNCTDLGKVIHSTVAKPFKEENESYDLMDAAWKEAALWLDQNYPDWRNSGAYWD